MLTEQTPWRLLLPVFIVAFFGLCVHSFSPSTDSAATASNPRMKATHVPPSQVKKPRAKPRFKLSHRHVTIGEAVRLKGHVRPGGKRKFKVVVKGPRADVISSRTNWNGRYRDRWRPTKPGIYRLRAFAGFNGRSRAGIGPRRTVTVYRPAHASWYGPGFYGNRTACGQTLTSGMLGVAHKTLPCGTKVRLRHGKKQVTVPVIDRGPFIPGRDYDLTYATKQRLGFGDLGTVYASR